MSMLRNRYVLFPSDFVHLNKQTASFAQLAAVKTLNLQPASLKNNNFRNRKLGGHLNKTHTDKVTGAAFYAARFTSIVTAVDNRQAASSAG